MNSRLNLLRHFPSRVIHLGRGFTTIFDRSAAANFTKRFVGAVGKVTEATDPGKSSELLRRLVKTKLVSYTDMSENPEKFFLAHRLLSTMGLGGFGIRFTVQFNLFAGSIVGLGGPEQVKALSALQESGELGCFLLTETQAGVLSGLIVETTATWNQEAQQFVLHTPSDSAAKNWISQGLTAEHGVVIADLLIKGKSYGPHPFLMRLRHSSSSSSSSSADCCNGGGNSGGSVVVDDAAEEQSNDDDGSESEGSTEGSTETVAWQCLDTARDLYQQALALLEGTAQGEAAAAAADADAPRRCESVLAARLRSELARTVSRLGDLNMATGCFADALVEYEQVLKFRETAQQQKKQGAPSSVADVCQLVDTNMQVAFAYLEHINANGEVNVEVQTTEGENVVVTAAVDCKTQMLAYREQAKKAMETLITRLANEQIKCTREDQDAMCVQIQLLEEFSTRLG